MSSAHPHRAKSSRRPLIPWMMIATAVSPIPLLADTQHWVGQQDYPYLYQMDAGSFFNAGMWRADLRVPTSSDDVYFGYDPNFVYDNTPNPNYNPQFYPYTVYFGNFYQHDVYTENVFSIPAPLGGAGVKNLFVATGDWTFDFGSGVSSAIVSSPPPPSSGSLTTTNYLAVGYQSNGHGPAALTCKDGGSIYVHDLKVGFAAGDTGTLNLTGGTSLSIDTYASVGYRGVGHLNLSGGATLTCTGQNFYVGDNTTAANGAITISDAGTSLNVPTILIGNLGSGSVVQSGGLLKSTGFVNLANAAHSTGQYTLSGGSIVSKQGIAIGRSGNGTFNQTGGDITVSGTGSIWVGQFAGSTSSYTLSGPFLDNPAVATTPYLTVGGTYTGGAGGVGHVVINNNATLTVTQSLELFNNSSSITVNAGGTLRAAALSLHGNQITLNGGTFILSGNVALNGMGAVAGNGVLDLAGQSRTFTSSAADNSFSISSSIINGSVVKSGPGVLTLSGSNSYAGTTVVNGGTLIVGKDAWSPLLLAGGAIITSGILVFDYAGASSPIDSIRASIASNTIHFSADNPFYSIGLAAVDNPDASTITLTTYGDNNLDGNITADDFALIDRGFAMHSAGFTNGDFNGDGAIDSADYLLIDTAYGQIHGLSPSFLSERQAQFGDAYVSQLLAGVPEPSCVVCLLGTLPFLSRRRRHTIIG